MRTVDRQRRLLTGWGRAVESYATVISADPDQIPAVIGEVGPRGAIARGLGRSYGDPALNSGGDVIELYSTPIRPDIAPLELIESDGSVAVRATGGVTIAQLIEYLIPRGYFVPVTPGTRLVTVGGAIASDIHGKNHHLDGSFGHHVTELDLALADGSVVTASPTMRPEIFWATIGGMGLTGVVLSATIRVLPVETSRIVVESRRIGDLDNLMAAMVESEATYRYSVAWLDVLARGAKLGRGVLTDGFHARIEDLDRAGRRNPRAYSGAQRASVPDLIPGAGLINRASVTAFNEMWYQKVPKHPTRTLETIPKYFHPLDAVGSWNRVYGAGGFVQYQVVVPLDASELVRTIVGRLSDARLPSFLSVLKRFGAGNPAPMSFPMPGWTLAVDLAARAPGLAPVLRELDEMVIDAGGRHYLAKDHLLGPGQIRRSYPRLAEWQQTRDEIDPSRIWSSDQSRRLLLTDTDSAPTSHTVQGVART